MNQKDHDEFLCRIAKTLYYGDTSSFDSVSLPLTELAAELYNEVKKDKSLERLQVREVAEINQNACVSTCSLVLAILYLEKIKTANPEYVEKVAPSELFLVSLLIASKFLNDAGDEDSVSNYEWAVCAGIPLKTVNKIEKKFLEAINWEVYIAKHQFWTRLRQMERYLANQEGKRRGWYSYTELDILATAQDLSILKEFMKYSAICVTCYATTVLSLIGTALLAIRIKHFLLNCVVYVLVKHTTLSNDRCCANSTAISEHHDLNETRISDVLYNEVSAADDSSENICDSSSLLCYYANITSAFLSLRIKIPSYSWMSRYVPIDKNDIVQKNSLFYSRNGWPNF